MSADIVELPDPNEKIPQDTLIPVMDAPAKDIARRAREGGKYTRSMARSRPDDTGRRATVSGVNVAGTSRIGERVF